jgi:hypothetical protein
MMSKSPRIVAWAAIESFTIGGEQIFFLPDVNLED